MSLNISGSKFVYVNNPKIYLDFSENVVFADLTTSKKTLNLKKDPETGKELVNENTGEPIYERQYSRWSGRFIGNAAEAAKALSNGDVIDIINGWIELFYDKDKKKTYTNVIITDFVLSNNEKEKIPF